MQRNFLAAMCVVLMTGSTAFAQRRGEIVAVVDLPAAVQTSADKATDDVDWLVSFKFAEPDQNWYRIAGREAKQNRLVKIMVFENGEVLDVRTEMPMEDVPAVVRAATKRRFPGFTPQTAEAVGKTMRSTIYYRFEGILDGVATAIIARPDGTKVLQEGKK
jgi:hypothetical protein